MNLCKPPLKYKIEKLLGEYSTVVHTHWQKQLNNDTSFSPIETVAYNYRVS